MTSFSFHASGQVGGLDAPQAVGAYFNAVFPATAPGQATGWQTENAFPNLTFVDPVWMTDIPGTSQFLLVGKNGQLWRFANNAAVTQVQVTKVLEWVAKTQSSEDQGFYSLVFHPRFGQAGSPNANYAYVCYNHKPALAGADSNHSFWRVSRFTWLPGSGTLDPASEFVLMNQYDRCRWHNGGAMFFDNDGFLHVNCGDGGDSGEGGGLTGADGALSRTQRLNGGLFSGVFRIDVDNDPLKSHPIRRQPTSPTNKPAGWPASFTQGYGIPNGNPWQDVNGGILEEYHSLGLRSPHTMHYDAVSGDIWIGDVGEGAREEMTRAPAGSNAQWGYMEGTIGGPGALPAPVIGTPIAPAHDYNRTTGTCIIGGMRYRGAKWNSVLGGKLLFGDHARGRIWTATLGSGGAAPVIEEIVTGFTTGNKAGLANFCTDSTGEIFLMNVNGTNTAGGTETRNWDYPSRADCMLCHNNASGQALGVKTASLNKYFHYEASGRDANQLATFNALGMFNTTLTAGQIEDYLEARPLDDETAPVEHRVRSYFDSNCSHCHRPGGTIDFFDARLGTPLHAQGLVNGTIQGFFSLGPDGRYIKPGNPDLSAVHVRLGNVGNGAAMPPLAKNVVDQEAVDLLQQYVTGLTEAEFQTSPSPNARYVRLTALTEVNGGAWTAVGEFSVLDGNGSPVPISEQSVFAYDSEELVDEFSPVVRVIDGNPDTFWHTEWGATNPTPPHFVTLDLGSLRPIGGFIYTPRQAGVNGRIANYQVHYSSDAVNWTLMTSGTWPNDAIVKRFDGLAGQRKARCEIAGPSGVVPGPFEVTVVFDMDVTDFTAADLQVAGGGVTDLRGKGYYYVATISPTSSEVSVTVPQDAANAAGLGSRSSAVIDVDFVDSQPPVPAFTAVPAEVTGPFQIRISFGEPVTGLTSVDFTVLNATLNSIVPAGTDYLLNLTPITPGTVGIGILSGAVSDTAGIPMGAGTSVSLLYLPQILARNASEASYIGGGMVLVTDPAAPHGTYLWLPDAAYPNNWQLPVKPQHRAEFSFVVPHAGQWMLRGLIRSSDASSDSFWVEIDGNQATGTVNLWDAGPVGTAYVWDYMNNRGVADPVVLNLSAGSHTVTVFGRDDGTRLDRLELESIRPLATLSGPSGVVNGTFTANLSFSESVTGLVAGDFSISGGSILSLTGSGAAYSLTIAPTGPVLALSLPENTVVDAGGDGNYVSNPLTVFHRTPYEQWAFMNGVDGSAASQLADEDGDGIAKLLEFAFNLDPADPDRSIYNPAVVPGSGLPRMIVTPGPALSLQYLRRKGVAGLGYRPQFGSSPDNFIDAPGSPLIESIDANWERATISDPAGSGLPRRFGRVTVTLAPP